MANLDLSGVTGTGSTNVAGFGLVAAATAFSVGDIVIVEANLKKGTVSGRLAAASDATQYSRVATVTLGIILAPVSAGQYIVAASMARMTDLGIILSAGTTTQNNVPYYLSRTPGRACLRSDLQAGDQAIVVGFGMSSNRIRWRPVITLWRLTS